MATLDRVTEPDDLAYVRANYATLAEICAAGKRSLVDARSLIGRRRVPGPSYVLADGTEMFPWDLFALLDETGDPEAVHAAFAQRMRAGSIAQGVPCTAEDLDRDWQEYVAGTYGICLKLVSPESIARKARLLRDIDRLCAEPEPDAPEWRRALQVAVDELDALERPFARFDRIRFGRPCTRDTHIDAVRRRFPLG